MHGGFTTAEGHWLPKPLLLPDARRFEDVLEYIGEWDTAWTMTLEAQRRAPEPTVLNGNHLGPYCQTQGFPWRHRSLAVRPTEATVAVLGDRIVTDDDHMHFGLVLHTDRDRVLVTLSYGAIIGSIWLAYVDPSTIPPLPSEV